MEVYIRLYHPETNAGMCVLCLTLCTDHAPLDMRRSSIHHTGYRVIKSLLISLTVVSLLLASLEIACDKMIRLEPCA